MRIGTLIKALGGPTAVAAALGLRLSTVGNWKMRDAIPREHHLAVWRLAIEKGIAWTPPGGDGLTLIPAANSPNAPKPPPDGPRDIPANDSRNPPKAPNPSKPKRRAAANVPSQSQSEAA
jgi:hypothetical protein